MKHLTLAEWADILVVAPATANIIGKAASGVGDDLLSTTLLSFPKPILIVPAMDTGMWDNSIVQENVIKLQKHGYYFLQPSFGVLASGRVGRGRFPSVSTIVSKIDSVFEKRSSLAGKNFLVTGGRTEEDIDPVRVVTNRSSGMMASELVRAILCRDGNVKGIFGKVTCPLPQEAEIMRVRTAGEMLAVLQENFGWCDCLLMAAAVGDYRPKGAAASKIHDSTLSVELEKNPDLLAQITKQKAKRIVVGFSLEDKDHLSRAQYKLKAKHLDFVVYNSPAAIAETQSAASIIRAQGKPVEFGIQTKWQLANCILDECIKQMPRHKQK